MPSISGHTKLAALLGDPVHHSLSPAMHNEAFRLLDLDYVYLAFRAPKESFEKSLMALKELGCVGCNITMPGKEMTASLCTRLSKEAALSHSVNTVIFRDGELDGYSTDGYGFMKTLENHGINLAGEKLTVLGSGGASTSICVQSAVEGAKEIAIFRRKGSKFEKAASFASMLEKETGCKVHVEDIQDYALLKETLSQSAVLANATNVGMGPLAGQSLVPDAGFFHPGLFVFDAIYEPRQTKLLQMAKDSGLACSNGLSMLLYQGAKAFSLFTGEEMPVEEIRKKIFPDA